MRFLIDAIEGILKKDDNLSLIIKKLRSVKNYDHGVKSFLALCLFINGEKGEAGKISKELLDNYSEVNIVNLCYGIINMKDEREKSKRLLKKSMVPSLYLNDPVLFYLLAETILKNKKILDKLKRESVVYRNNFKLKYDYDVLMKKMFKN